MDPKATGASAAPPAAAVPPNPPTDTPPKPPVLPPEANQWGEVKRLLTQQGQVIASLSRELNDVRQSLAAPPPEPAPFVPPQPPRTAFAPPPGLDPELEQLKTQMMHELRRELDPMREVIGGVAQTYKLQQEALQRKQAEAVFDGLAKGADGQPGVAPIFANPRVGDRAKRDFNAQYAQQLRAYGGRHEMVDVVGIARQVQADWDGIIGAEVQARITPAGTPPVPPPGSGAPTAGAPATGPFVGLKRPGSVREAHEQAMALQRTVAPQPGV